MSDPAAVLENALLNAAVSHKGRARMLLRELEVEGFVVVPRPPGEAVEAGARAAFDHAMATSREHAAPWATAALAKLLGETWEQCADERRDHYRSVARDVITAYEAAKADA